MLVYDFNPEIFEKLTEYNITDVDTALLYLLAVKYELNSSCLPEEIIRQVNITKIVERDYATVPVSVRWNVQLFANSPLGNADEQDAWKWIEDYRNLFGNLRADAKGDKKGVLSKMKKFFAANPEYRVHQIMQAARMYLSQFQNGGSTQYLQRADYFISKKIDGVEQSRLLNYLEQVKEHEARAITDNSPGNRFNTQVKS